LPSALPAKDLPREQTEILTVRRMRRIDIHVVESDVDIVHECISDSDNCLTRNGDLDNQNDSDDDCAADVESDIENANGIEDPECSEQQDESAATNISRLICPVLKSKRWAEMILVMFN
jgi:hypothetical protein